MNTSNLKKQARLKRKKRIRKKMIGTQLRPRLSVFRSAKHIYTQLIDDNRGHTLTAASSLEKAVKEHSKSNNNIVVASFVGKLVAERAIKLGIKKVVFDRNGFLYHGRIKAVSDGAREAGLNF